MPQRATQDINQGDVSVVALKRQPRQPVDAKTANLHPIEAVDQGEIAPLNATNRHALRRQFDQAIALAEPYRTVTLTGIAC